MIGLAATRVSTIDLLDAAGRRLPMFATDTVATQIYWATYEVAE